MNFSDLKFNIGVTNFVATRNILKRLSGRQWDAPSGLISNMHLNWPIRRVRFFRQRENFDEKGNFENKNLKKEEHLKKTKNLKKNVCIFLILKLKKN